MNKAFTSRNVFRLVAILLFVVCIATGCKKDTKSSDVGIYKLYTMESGADVYDHETIVKYGLDAMTLILYEDGSASLAFADETPTQMSWKQGMIIDHGTNIPYTIEAGKLSLSHNDENMVFERVGCPPKKAEIQTPSDATDNRMN